MKKKKEVNQELRAKIIQLIHKELEEVQGENIFIDLGYNFREMCPFYEVNVVKKGNIDEQVIDKPDAIRFALKFKDGEPDIQIYTYFNFTYREEPYKKVWSWRGRKQLFTKFTEYTVTTEITCGHILFNLTEEEHQDLINRTKASWNKYQSLKDIALDNKVLDKINMRLKK